MARINGDDYILSFGLEESNEFQQLHSLKVNDKIIIKSHSVSYAPKYAYPIISGDYVERDSKIIYKRAPRKGGCWVNKLWNTVPSSSEQNQAEVKKNVIYPETKGVITSQGPGSLVRKIIQDSKGNILMVLWEGIIRSDGKSITNITSEVSSARFLFCFRR